MMEDMSADDEFAEFDTSAEEILAVINAGELVTFGDHPRITRLTAVELLPPSKSASTGTTRPEEQLLVNG